MKRGAIVLCLAVFLGFLSFVVGYWWCGGRSHHLEMHTHRELAWLEHEFRLTPEQAARIAEIHHGFLPVCDDLCMKIAAASGKISDMIATNRMITPEIESAIQEAARIHLQSRMAVLEHIFEISREMSPEQSGRYLSMMMPQVLDVPYSIGGTH